MPRISIKTVYMQNAYQYATLSYAERRKVGCVIVKDHQVISFGYNGTPHGFDNECEINDMTKPEVLHAESNAIMKVAKSTMSCEGAELFTTTCPCFGCAKLIIQAGISKVYYTEEYRDMSGVALLGKAGIVVEHLKLENEYK
ncbi:dCMP deaminase family protein [bacterium]|nr:dCMP deaminase family protein [bacterium]